MFVVGPEDIIAIRRAFMDSRNAAMAECRRRWPAIADQALPDVLDRALLMRITEPPPPRPRSPGAFHHGLADSGKRR